jgi:hypothetical protein
MSPANTSSPFSPPIQKTGFPSLNVPWQDVWPYWPLYRCSSWLFPASPGGQTDNPELKWPFPENRVLFLQATLSEWPMEEVNGGLNSPG